ncbi:hypothetical protein A3E35_00085 [Candidatus Giovannonibacteria bacterium RIFCSPHIGHO2_12_FULL_44_22]|nr:MAG: hypothetical protein A2652_01080 [Candidatus Giovannonibacteria bacterium RIFCSPHIGHO2_01_FULL_43_140]OGF71341.1 MAG: hypothetical protein A3E35_00085 [Candidatus Giovannonibacteria bacterium RIFCSPHIGHO2_12_FULL_44_22]
MSPNAKKVGAVFLMITTLFLPFYTILAAQVIQEIQPLNKPFGGKIIKIQACIIPKALLLTIGPPMGGKYLLTDSSTLHAYDTIMPGVWTLGLAEPNAVNCRGNPAGIAGFAVNTLISTALNFIPVVGQILSLVYTLFSFIFPKKPPSLGNGYPIIRIGTGPAPNSLPSTQPSAPITQPSTP